MLLRAGSMSVTASMIVIALTSCGGGGGTGMPSPPSVTAMPAPLTMMDTDRSVDADADNGSSTLRGLGTIGTIGSTIDPLNGDLNPYGLDIAKASAGSIRRGDLVVCNFNDAANVQGTGTTIVALHPQEGAAPTHIAQAASLLGCDALAAGPTGNLWNAAFAANDNPIVSSSGTVLTTLPGGPWHHPFGETFAGTPTPFGNASFYVSNAGDGSIVRVNVKPGPSFTFDVIATGFAVNGGAPGSILGPSGLQYDAQHDRLYIVDGADNSLTAFRHVSTIPTGGITVSGGSFGGPFAKRARRVFAGAPLNGPISSALLPDGHLVLGNTLDPDGTNLMVEITFNGRVAATKNVDTGAAGALFGMVASGSNGAEGDVKVYFHDDNANAVMVLSR